MNTAIVFVDKEDQATLAWQKILDKKLIDYTVDRLKQAGSDKIIVVCQNAYQSEGVICLNDPGSLSAELVDIEGKLIITGIHYPNIDSDIYSSLYRSDSEAGVVTINGKMVEIFVIESNLFADYERLQYEPFNIVKDDLIKVSEADDLYKASKAFQKVINARHLKNGVSFIDIENTYIGEDVVLESGVCLYPSVFLEGKTVIGENTLITANSHIIDSHIGKNCQILSSRISDSCLHDAVTLGPYAHIRMHCEIMDGARIGNFVEFKNTQFGRISRCAHLTYLGDSEVGEDVNIGCGVITVNYDGKHKFRTTIKDRAFVGSNSNLIAPVTIGESVLVAAGSTITKDVEDGAMAIARSRQEIKPGFGFKYINKEGN